MRHSARRVLLIAALPCLAGPVLAQDRRDAVRTLDELAACRAIAADAQRLACFDRIAAGVVAARSSGDLLVFDRKKVEETRRARFGLADPPPAQTAGAATPAGAAAPAAAAPVNIVRTRVKAAQPGRARGFWVMDLDNGQRWRTLETISMEPRPGMPIRLRTTVTGGFRASLANGMTFGVRRVR